MDQNVIFASKVGGTVILFSIWFLQRQGVIFSLPSLGTDFAKRKLMTVSPDKFRELASYSEVASYRFSSECIHGNHTNF